MRLDSKLIYRILEEASNFQSPEIDPTELWTTISQTYGYEDEQVFGYTLKKMHEGGLITNPFIRTKTHILNRDFEIEYEGHMFLNALNDVPKEKLNKFFIETAKMSVPAMLQAAKSQFGL
ncbi:hypothetical protein ACFOU0_05965 [Salinicoccus sesuvii]|uniref:Transcriptional regulator n=1 Tax=Salinicoccus sesuvii TaxID=868281 RepID=A0ABV7N3E1_9STAP